MLIFWVHFDQNFIIAVSCKNFTKSDGTCACAFDTAKRMTWTSAIHECLSYGARLPEIMNDKENEDILSLMVSLQS